MGTEASQIVDQIQQAPVQGLQPTTEPEAKEALTQAPRPEDKVSSKIDILIRREQQALARERQAKQRETALEEKLKRLEEFESVKTNPKKALELLGLDYDQLTQTILNDGHVPPDVHIKKLEDKFDSFKSAQEQAEQRRVQEAENAQKQNLEVATGNFKKEINQYLDDNKDRYEYTHFEGAQDLVFEVIDEHYNRTQRSHAEELAKLGESVYQAVGKVLSISEAADKVEQHMEQKYNRAKELNKTKTLWGAVPQGTLRDAAKPEPREQKKPATLTNNMSASAQSPRKTPLNDDERVQKAIAYAKSLRP